MQLQVPADLEAMINKRLARGGYDSVEDVLREALQAQEAEEAYTEEERKALSALLEERFVESENCELMDEAQARRKMEAKKAQWLAARQ